MSLLKPLFQWQSPAGIRARLSVLIFHRVLPQQDPLFPNEMYASRFDRVCSWLSSWFNVLPLDQAILRLQQGTLPARAASITFDDGYADNHHVALPLLRSHSLTATFFIATGFLDGGRMWNDTIIESVRGCTRPELDLGALNLGRHPLGSVELARAAIESLISDIKYRSIEERVGITEQIASLAGVRPPEDLMMTSQEVKSMRQSGMQIGAHTISHPILARLGDEAARQEIQGSKTFLEQLLEERVALFAYPNGKPGEDYTAHSVDIVRGLGFDAAVSTRWGCSAHGDDLFEIRRFTPWDQSRLRFGLRLISNLRKSHAG